MGTLRKILTTGVGAALMTESGLRGILSDIKVRDYIAKQAMKGKEEISRVLASEIKGFLERINIHEEIQKALEDMLVEIQATVKLKTDQHHSKKSTRMTIHLLKIKKLS